MDATKQKRWKRNRRQLRVRGRVAGKPERPRLAVHRTVKHMYVQVIDDESGRTLCAASTLSPELRGAKVPGNTETSRKLGEHIAKKAKACGLSKVVFDRGGCMFHGRVKAVAEGARAGGLEF